MLRLINSLVSALRREWGATSLLLAGSGLLAVQAFEPALPAYLRVGLFVLGTVAVTVSSIWLGRSSVTEAARDLIAPLADPPFQRTLALYGALGRLAAAVQDKRRALRAAAKVTGSVTELEIQAALDGIGIRIEETLITADTAFAEWERIIPDEVQALRGEVGKEIQ